MLAYCEWCMHHYHGQKAGIVRKVNQRNVAVNACDAFHCLPMCDHTFRDGDVHKFNAERRATDNGDLTPL